jgi:hypothetical protein
MYGCTDFVLINRDFTTEELSRKRDREDLESKLEGVRYTRGNNSDPKREPYLKVMTDFWNSQVFLVAIYIFL